MRISEGADPLFRLSRACSFAQLVAARARIARKASINFVCRISSMPPYLPALICSVIKTDLVHAGSLRDVDDLDHVLIEQVGIGIDEGSTLVTGLENLLKLIAQITKFD